MNLLKMLPALLVLLSLTGCAATSTTSFTQAEKQTFENSFVLQSDIDDVWEAAIHGLSKDFFVIDHIEKDSGIITLSYSSNTPENYVDCGKVTVDTKGASNASVHTYDFAKGYTEFFAATDGTPHPKKLIRAAHLSGKMNIVFKEISKKETEVTVNTKYILDTALKGQRYIITGGFGAGYFQDFTDSKTYNFTNVTPSSNPVCYSKGELEAQIYEAIKSELSN